MSHYVGEELGGAVAGAWDKLKSDGRNWWAVHTGQRPSYAPPDGAGLVSQARYGVRMATDEANILGLSTKLGGDVYALATSPIAAAIHGAFTRPLATAASYIPGHAYEPATLVLDDNGIHYRPERPITRAESELRTEHDINLALLALGPKADLAEAGGLRSTTFERTLPPPVAEPPVPQSILEDTSDLGHPAPTPPAIAEPAAVASVGSHRQYRRAPTIGPGLPYSGAEKSLSSGQCAEERWRSTV